MAATFNVYYDFGGTDGSPGTEQNTDSLGPPNVRLKTADDATIDLNNPIPIPDAGTNYSYWKHIYLKCATAPDTQVDNVKFYADGTGFGTGITLNIGDELPTKNSGADTGYNVATGTEGTSGDVMTEHSEITGVTNAFDYTSASPKSISISESGNIIDAIGETTNYIVLQMAVADNASSGDLSNETMTFQYDEI
jgi:hypothetical protein